MQGKEVLIYDVECFLTLFICAVRLKTLDGVVHNHCFEIHERQRAFKAFRRSDCFYVGHNSSSYDNLMLAYWLDANPNERQLKYLNDYLIEARKPDDAKTNWWIKENVRSSEWIKFGAVRRRHQLGWNVIERLGWRDRLDVDTLILGEGQGSLKNCAINLGFVDLVEAPVSWDAILTDDEKNLVRKYCFNDVDVTERLFEWYAQIMDVRKEFYDMGIKQAYIVGSAKLAELYLLKRHENEIGSVAFAAWKKEAYDVRLTYREFDPVKDLIGKYKFAFKDSGFRSLWDRIKDCDLLYTDGITLANFDTAEAEQDDEDWKKKMFDPSPFRNKDGVQIPKGDLIITDDRGMVYQFGVGGLHNIAPRGLWKATNEMAIFNMDVGSMYPSLIIANNFAPRQFKEFSPIMSVLKIERMAHKRAKRKIKEQAQKLVLNAGFGKLRDTKSILFDPKACFSVTVSGQLLLIYLIDLIYQVSPDSIVINANTDGVCLYTPRKDLATIKAAMKYWETFSALSLEDEHYKTFAQATCNLYCALDEHNKIKSKGGGWKLKATAMRETMTESAATKKMAIECLLHGKHPLETCVKLTKEDFAMSAGFGGKRTLVVDGVPQRERRALRYAWVKQGSILQKLEKRGLSIVGEGQRCQVLDTMDALDDSNINRDYYIEKSMEKVLEIVGTHTTHNLPKKVLKNLRENFDTWFISQAQNKVV